MSDTAVPWAGQEGEGPFRVVFDGKVFFNRWYVAATDCPKQGSTNDNPNFDSPWESVRDATEQEIAQGNPTTCDLTSAED
ncbi:hypothetical protein ACIOUE_35880 [Streptomyces xanthochromogenes]|uniref:hypothetical protein n=1 Tax=Streptomyces xanthochromogenes TaxID=67384 RepID=UPI0037FBB515